MLFSLGLSMTVTPLTAAIFAGVSQDEVGIGSDVNDVGIAGALVIGGVVGAVGIRNRRRALEANAEGLHAPAPT